MPKFHKLGPGYTVEIDTLNQQTWCQLLQEFDDASIYQTWPYVAVTAGPRNMSHLLLRKNGDVVAAALARIAKLPFARIGAAYIRWAPLWRRRGTDADSEVFRYALRALRNEFACNRRLVLRFFPLVFEDESPSCRTILAEEGFSSLEDESRGRTILMDLTPPIGDLREGMGRNWRRNLKQAEQNGLEVVEGTDDELFKTFVGVYKQTVLRKGFVEPNDINQFRLIQAQLPDNLKMKIMLCKSAGEVCAGLVSSAMGKTGIELFAATSDAGMQSRGSHLLRWKFVDWLKQEHFAVYNLNGINPDRNPGTYKFKSDLAGKNGRDVRYLGRFDARDGLLSYCCVKWGDAFRMRYGKLKELVKAGRALKPRPEAAS